MIQLTSTTSDPQIDDILLAIITIYETVFPQRIRGYYLIGSYGDDSAIVGSDVDLMIVFKGTVSPTEYAQQDSIKASCRTLCPLHLDLPIIAEADFEKSDTVALKQGSKFIYGTDTRDSIPSPTHDVYLQSISTPTQRGLTFRFRQERITLPLDYPVPDDPYLGYIPHPYVISSTPIKLWVLNVGWLATFLVVYHAEVYIPSKRHMLKAYETHIGDEWRDFIAAVYENGRNRWAYQIPEEPKDYDLFLDLCRRTLAFENHVAPIYLDYLKNDLMQLNPQLATDRLGAFIDS